MKGTSQDRGALLIFAFIGVGVMVEAVMLSVGDWHKPGPGFMTLLLGFSMAVLSAIAFFDRPGGGIWKNWAEARIILLVFGALFLYLVLMPVLGFYLDTFLLTIGLMKVCGERGFLRSLLVALTTAILVYVLFFRVFVIPFPEGIFGF